MKLPENVNCPHCAKPVGLAVTSSLLGESRMSFKLVPNPGELMSAKTIGKAIDAMHDLLVAVGKELGAKTNVLVESITSDNGSVKVDMLLTRHEPGVKKRK